MIITMSSPHLQSLFPFSLSPFQRDSISSIQKGDDVFVTAHTGSGKTVPAIYAIERALRQNKKAIYTSPIKSLSNQKYAEWTEKYPSWNIGLITGDFKLNPNGDVLIMTTEILQSYLFQQTIMNETSQLMTIDLYHELGIVVFDEVHYMNDPDRGKVWENCLSLLPSTIQLVLLSATIDADDFLTWMRSEHCLSVHHYGTKERPVPLYHSLLQPDPEEPTKSPPSCIPLFDSNGIMNKEQLMETITHDKHIQRVPITKSISFIKKKHQLPVLCFVFSRKRTKQYATSLQENYLSQEEQKESSSLVRRYLHGRTQRMYETSLNYHSLVYQLLPRGIGYHHAGMEPRLKEIIEVLFSRGLIKILFATETFAVGVNSPTKSVLFTSLLKYDGNREQIRCLYSHEYKQMAGRAGRRGLDTKGYVYIAPCQKDEIYDGLSWKQMLCGTFPSMQSQQKLDCTTFIHYLPHACSPIQEHHSYETIQERMIQQFVRGFLLTQFKQQAKHDYSYIQSCQQDIQKRLDDMVSSSFQEECQLLVRMKRNAQKKKLVCLKKEYAQDYIYMNQVCELIQQRQRLDMYLNDHSIEPTRYVQPIFQSVIQVFTQMGYLFQDMDTRLYSITNKGIVASQIYDIHPIFMTELFFSRIFETIPDLSLFIMFCLDYVGTKVGDLPKRLDCYQAFQT